MPHFLNTDFIDSTRESKKAASKQKLPRQLFLVLKLIKTGRTRRRLNRYNEHPDDWI